jgi:hypothetical protein
MLTKTALCPTTFGSAICGTQYLDRSNMTHPTHGVNVLFQRRLDQGETGWFGDPSRAAVAARSCP